MNNMAVRNNGGGHYNHTMFWEIMSPNGGGLPTGDLAAAIDAAFGSLMLLKLNSLKQELLVLVQDGLGYVLKMEN